VPVPTDGKAWPYAEMLAWCRENLALGWEQHGYMDRSAATTGASRSTLHGS
jgi:hypothetical protein